MHNIISGLYLLKENSLQFILNKAFKHKKSTISDKAMAISVLSKYSHLELVFLNGHCLVLAGGIQRDIFEVDITREKE